MLDDADSFSLDTDPPKCGPDLNPPVLRVYLASALTNLDPHQQAEAATGRSIICDLFHRYDYFGIRFEVYDPAEVTPPGSEHSNDEVYITDHHQTSKSDLVVFYVLTPSLGVGMEAQIAADCTLPRVVISRRDSAVSRMFCGVFSPTIASLEYNEVSELRNTLSTRLLDISEAAVESAKRRRGHVEGFCENALGQTVMRRRLAIGVSLQELASKTDIRESWLQRIEWDPSLAASVTLIELHRIAAELNAAATVTEAGFPTITVSDTEASDVERESLNNLVEFARGGDQPRDDDRVLLLWKAYQQQVSEESVEAGRHRGAKMIPVSVDEWRRRYVAKDGLLF